MQQWPVKTTQKLLVSVMLCSECCKPEQGSLGSRHTMHMECLSQQHLLFPVCMLFLGETSVLV